MGMQAAPTSPVAETDISESALTLKPPSENANSVGGVNEFTPVLSLACSFGEYLACSKRTATVFKSSLREPNVAYRRAAGFRAVLNLEYSLRIVWHFE